MVSAFFGRATIVLTWAITKLGRHRTDGQQLDAVAAAQFPLPQTGHLWIQQPKGLSSICVSNGASVCLSVRSPDSVTADRQQLEAVSDGRPVYPSARSIQQPQ
jgi:hypothetical protein